MLRSWLYVPGDRPDRYDKALRSGADAVVVDLQDAVAPGSKPAARAALAAWAPARAPAAGGVEVWVRVNAGAEREADLDVVRRLEGVTGLVLAACASAEEVAEVAAEIPRAWLSPLLETPAGVVDCGAMARSPRVRCLQIGEFDLAAELGLDPSEDESELAPYRARVVLASAAAAVQPPPAPVSVEIADLARFRVTTERAARQGFVGRACIHPAQLGVVHDVFTPDAETLARARTLVAAFDAQVAAGVAVAVDGTGRMVDPATVRAARRTVALAGPD